LNYLDEVKRRQAAYHSLGLVRALIVAGALPKEMNEQAEAIIRMADYDSNRQ